MKKRNGTKPVGVDRPSATKKLIVGAMAVLSLAICLSVGVAKGVFSPTGPATGTEPATSDNRGVTTGSSPLTWDGSGQGLAAMSQAAADNKFLFAFFCALATSRPQRCGRCLRTPLPKSPTAL